MRLCHVFEDRPRNACACVRTFLTSWEVLRAVDQTPAVALHLFDFFWLLFVSLLC